MNETALKFFIDLTKVGTTLSRKFDGSLGGLGWNEFIILYHLSRSPDEKLRRIDLAEKVGLTASGVTRILLPMEKIGLVTKESNADDARVSLVVLAPGGKRKLEEGVERALLVANEIVPENEVGKIPAFSDALRAIGGAIMWR
jgi:DNA-binding MarR family transcriptional regulator